MDHLHRVLDEQQYTHDLRADGASVSWARTVSPLPPPTLLTGSPGGGPVRLILEETAGRLGPRSILDKVWPVQIDSSSSFFLFPAV